MAAGFQRTLKLPDAIMINLGAIVGAGIFVIIGISAASAGPAILISIPLAGMVAIFTGISFSQIARHVDKEGGVYEYGKEAISQYAGFVGGSLWTFGNIIALSAVSISFGGYLDSIFSSRFPVLIIGVLIITVFAVLNIMGVKNSAKTLRAIVIVNLTILFVFSVVGFFYFHPSHFSDFFSKGYSGILSGGAIIFFAFSGFSRVTTVSEEVIDPEKTIPKAIIISILISIVIYSVIAISAIGLATSAGLASSTSPLAFAASRTGLPALVLVVSLGALVATSGVILTGILGTSRVMYAMGRDGELPHAISRLDRFSTPIVAIVVSLLLAIAMMPAASFGTIVESSNTCVISAYAIINLAALKTHLKYRHNGKKVCFTQTGSSLYRFLEYSRYQYFSYSLESRALKSPVLCFLQPLFSMW
ncbi:amino acid permease [Oxyplasma meridianum]|uniref:Amino acid permease n=1 Tax=Oxyplasma meridianum TaxID=3073602 RepID=A0AAX4NF64_9ARCH